MIKKKVLLVSHSPLLSGGAELSLLEIATYLKNSDADLKVMLPAKGAFSDRLDELNIPNQIANYRWSVTFRSDKTKTHEDIGIFNADSIIEAYNIISLFKPDVILTNTIVVPWFGYAAKALGVAHTLLISELYDDSSNLKFLPNDEVYLNQIKHSTDFIFYNSQFTASTYGNIFTGIESGISYPTVKIPADDMPLLKRSLKNFSTPVKLIVYGSIARHKNQTEALKALSILIKNGINAELTILGPIGVEEYFKELKALIRKLKIGKYVNFLPFMERPFKVIHEHDIVLVPSLSETFGRVTAEGQLLGRIVIGSNVSATAELIKDGETGYLYELGNADSLAAKIEEAVRDLSKSREIAKNAQQRAYKKFIMNDHNLVIKDELYKYAYKQPVDDENFNFIKILIERNIYTNNKILEYANALSESISVNQELESKLLDKKIRRMVTKLLAIVRR